LLRTREGATNAYRRAVVHLKALVVTAPELLRHQLRQLATDALLTRCARLRTTSAHSEEHRATVIALRLTARRALLLQAEADDLESLLQPLVCRLAQPLLDEPGIGVLTAAQILNAWSHPRRLRSEAAFAALAGVAPIPASSGQVVRYRLNRCGDRQLNCALHTIVLSRCTHHPETRQYVTRRRAEGRSDREIRRCLKRFVARRVFRLLEGKPSDMAA
jgi:transposase